MNKLLDLWRRFKKRYLASNSTIIGSIRLGMIYAIPVFVVGSIGLVIQYFPVTAYQDFIATALNGNLKKILDIINTVTFGAVSLVLTITIAYSRSKNLLDDEKGDISYVIVAIVSFVCLSDFNTTTFNPASFNVQGIIIAIISAILSTGIFNLITVYIRRHKKIKQFGFDNAFNKVTSFLLPFSIVVIIFAFFRFFLYTLGIDSIQGSITEFLVGIFNHVDSNFFAGLLYVVLVGLLWFFCIHGGNALQSVADVKFASLDNGIFSKTFNDVFVLMGGCGAIICLVIAVLIFSKSKRTRKVTLTSMPFVAFNISEIMVFGFPVVFNPIFFIPFILVPVILYCISYGAIYLEIVPMVTNNVQWTCPIFFSGYIATGSINGLLLQLCNLVIGVLIYGIFVKINDKLVLKQYSKDVKYLCDLLFSSEAQGEKVELLKTGNYYHALMLASDIYDALENNQIMVYYQPQMNKKGKCYGAEALLRYKHPQLGFIAPPLVVQLAKESGFLERLERYVFEQAISFRSINDMGLISINATSQSFVNDKFIKNIYSLCDTYKLDHDKIAIEITEETIIVKPEKVEELINQLKSDGFPVILDDFGMGHTSLIYLQKYGFNTVKIAAEIIKEIEKNKTSLDIVKSIVDLGKNLGYTTTAEFVETVEGKNMLVKLGVDHYQGYLYSKPISDKEYIEFYNKNKVKEKIE